MSRRHAAEKREVLPDAKYGDRVTTTRENFTHNDRAIAEGETEGFLKIVHVGKKVVGATAVGRHSGDLLLPWAQMIIGKTSLLRQVKPWCYCMALP